MQPRIFSYFSTLVEISTMEDLDMACPVMPTIEDLICPMAQKQPKGLGHLDAAFVEDHCPGSFEQSSAAPTQTLRDFEKHLNDLKKENFSLKLRIYFLEERMQQKYEGTKEDVYRQNIELKVEVESLKQELQQQKSWDRSWATSETPHSQNEEESGHRQKAEQTCILERKIQQLQEEAQSAKVKAQQMSALAEAEKDRCSKLTTELLEFSKKQEESRNRQEILESYSAALAEKDRKIEELTWDLRDKEQWLEQLSAEKQQILGCLEQTWENKNSCKDHHQLTQCDLPKQQSGLSETELLEKINHFSAINKQLQMKLNDMNFELETVQHASEKQDHKIQNLNESLKNKEKEAEELYHVIEGQNETITRLQDMLHRSQLGQLQLSDGSSMLHQKQKAALLDAQKALFSSQLEAEQLKRIQQKKDVQLAEARRTIHFLETALQEEEKQKETTWKYNQELRVTVQQLETELQNKKWQCSTLEREHFSETQRQEQKIQHLSHKVTCKEKLLQESKELLQYFQNLNENPTAADNMVKKLQQRVKDRDAMLEEAIDEKFFVLEDRDQELQQLHASVKEREHDLERLHRVLSNNEATIQGLDGLLKAKDLELGRILVSYQSLQWLKEEVAAKCQKWQAEQEGVNQQLRTALYEKNKELEVLSARLLCKLGPGQRDILEELNLQLQQKEQAIEELLRDKSQQAMEQVAELQELLKAASAKEQQNYALRQECSGRNTSAVISKKEDNQATVEKGDFATTVGLEKDLTDAKEELKLLIRKERKSSLELSALQSLVASQEKDLQVQTSDIESLTRNIQIKEELIKDLQMQLVDPEEMPVVEQLTKEVLALQEKVAKLEVQVQGAAGNRRQELLMVLEGLVSENSQLSEALKAEKQLYSSLMKFHANTASTELGESLQVKLEEVQVLRGRLEEALGRSLECLNRLESLDGIGGGNRSV